MSAKVTYLAQARARLAGRFPARRAGQRLDSPLDAALRAVATCPDAPFLYKTRLFQEIFQAELRKRGIQGG